MRLSKEKAGPAGGNQSATEDAIQQQNYRQSTPPVTGALGVDANKVNIHGGNVVLGHPTGMSGNRITLDVLNSLKEDGGRYGLATICGNGGHEGAIVVELIK